MYSKDIILKPNYIYANLQQETGDIKYTPSTITAIDFNEIGIDEYLGNSLTGLPDTQNVTVAMLTNDEVQFQYNTVANLKSLTNIKKVFSKELSEQEKAIITSLIKGDIIMKNNIVYVENFSEVE